MGVKENQIYHQGYESPEVSIIDVLVEKGFAASGDDEYTEGVDEVIGSW